jgi:hypothetical protein
VNHRGAYRKVCAVFLWFDDGLFLLSGYLLPATEISCGESVNKGTLLLPF